MDLLWPAIQTAARLAWWLARMPVVIALRLFHGTRRLAGAVTLLQYDALPCRGCGQPVSLVGRWQCGRCRYTTDGFMFARCPVCHSVPPFIPCPNCGVALRNPTHG
jgi:hypothetical protein